MSGPHWSAITTTTTMDKSERKPMFSRGFLIAMIPVAAFGAVVLINAQREMDRVASSPPVAIDPPPATPVLRTAAQLTDDERLWAAGVMAGANCKAAGGTDPATVRAAYNATFVSRGIDGASVADDPTIVDASKTIYMQQCPGQLLREQTR